MRYLLVMSSALVLAACSVTQPTKTSTPGKPWHTVTTPAPAAGETVALVARQHAAGRSIVSVINRERRPAVRAVLAANFAKPVNAKAAADLMTALPAAELQKADSLLKTLQAQNKHADTIEQGVVAAGKVRRKVRSMRNAAEPQAEADDKPFKFQPTNIGKNDTVFIDSHGVKLALWIGPKGIEQKVAKGAVVEKSNSNGATDVSVHAGFDWQPYRVSLLIIGTLSALALLFALTLSLFPHRTQPLPSERLV
jgi:hypothetical protein